MVAELNIVTEWLPGTWNRAVSLFWKTRARFGDQEDPYWAVLSLSRKPFRHGCFTLPPWSPRTTFSFGPQFMRCTRRYYELPPFARAACRLLPALDGD